MTATPQERGRLGGRPGRNRKTQTGWSQWDGLTSTPPIHYWDGIHIGCPDHDLPQRTIPGRPACPTHGHVTPVMVADATLAGPGSHVPQPEVPSWLESVAGELHPNARSTGQAQAAANARWAKARQAADITGGAS